MPFVLGMQHSWFLQCSVVLLMKKPSVLWSSCDPLSIGLLCIGTLVPAVEIGCFMKFLMSVQDGAHGDMLLILDGLSGFIVNSVCGIGRSH